MSDMYDDLDFDLDDINFDDIDFNSAGHDDSGPVLKVSRAFIDGLKEDAISGNRIENQLDMLLPVGLRDAKRDLSKVYSEFSKEFDKSKNSFKRSSKNILLDISKLVPKGVIKDYLSKHADGIEVEKSGYQRDTTEEDESARQSEVVASIFAGAQSKVFATGQARSEVQSENQHRQTLSLTKTSLQLADETRAHLAHMDRFNEYINLPYQKKSLEIQLKSLYLSKQHYELSKLSSEKTVGYLEGILHNTGIPDYRKSKLADIGAKGYKERAMESLLNSSAIRESAIGRTATRIKDRATNLTMSALGMAQQGEMVTGMAGSMGGMGGGMHSMAGSTGSGFLLDFLYNRAGRSVSNAFRRGTKLRRGYLRAKETVGSYADSTHEKAKEGQEYLDSVAHSPIFGDIDNDHGSTDAFPHFSDYDGEVEYVRNDDGTLNETATQKQFEAMLTLRGEYADQSKGQTKRSKIWNRLKNTVKAKSNIFVSDLLKEDEYREPILVESQNDLYKQVSFDQRTHTTVNRVIPGLLSRINDSIRLGAHLEPEGVKWDYVKGEFATGAEMLKRTRDQVEAGLDTAYLDSSVQRNVEEIARGANLTEDELNSLRGVLTTGVAESQMGIRSINDFNGLVSDDYRDKFSDLTDEQYNALMVKLRNKKNAISIDDIDDISGNMRDLSRQYQDPTESLSFLANRERHDELEKLGVLKRDAAGSMRLDKEGYLNFLRTSTSRNELDIDASGQYEDYYDLNDNPETSPLHSVISRTTTSGVAQATPDRGRAAARQESTIDPMLTVATAQLSMTGINAQLLQAIGSGIFDIVRTFSGAFMKSPLETGFRMPNLEMSRQQLLAKTQGYLSQSSRAAGAGVESLIRYSAKRQGASAGRDSFNKKSDDILDDVIDRSVLDQTEKEEEQLKRDAAGDNSLLEVAMKANFIDRYMLKGKGSSKIKSMFKSYKKVGLEGSLGDMFADDKDGFDFNDRDQDGVRDSSWMDKNNVGEGKYNKRSKGAELKEKKAKGKGEGKGLGGLMSTLLGIGGPIAGLLSPLRNLAGIGPLLSLVGSGVGIAGMSAKILHNIGSSSTRLLKSVGGWLLGKKFLDLKMPKFLTGLNGLLKSSYKTLTKTKLRKSVTGLTVGAGLLGLSGGAEGSESADVTFDKQITKSIEEKIQEEKVIYDRENQQEKNVDYLNTGLSAAIVAGFGDKFLLKGKGSDAIKNLYKKGMSKAPAKVNKVADTTGKAVNKTGGIMGKLGKGAAFTALIASLGMGSNDEEKDDKEKSLADYGNSALGALFDYQALKFGLGTADKFLLKGKGSKALGAVSKYAKSSGIGKRAMQYSSKAKGLGTKALQYASRYKGAANTVMRTMKATPKNPWALGTAAAGLIGYGTYRLYKGDLELHETGYLTLTRFAQYGAFPVLKENQDVMQEAYTKLYLLEGDVLESGNVTISGTGEVSIDYNPYNAMKLFDVPEEKEGLFAHWFNDRFIPVLGAHLSVYSQMGYFNEFYSMDLSATVGSTSDISLLNGIRERIFNKLMKIPSDFSGIGAPPNIGLHDSNYITGPDMYAKIGSLLRTYPQPYPHKVATDDRTNLLKNVSRSTLNESLNGLKSVLGKNADKTMDAMVDSTVKVFNTSEMVKTSNESVKTLAVKTMKAIKSPGNSVYSIANGAKKLSGATGVIKKTISAFLDAIGIKRKGSGNPYSGNIKALQMPIYDKGQADTISARPDIQERLIASGFIDENGKDPYFFTEAEDTPEKRERIKRLCVEVAKSVGLDPITFLSFIAVESGFRPYARPYSRRLGKYLSTAKGVAQILNGTWKEWVGKWGREYGIVESLTAYNVKASLLFAARNAKENKVGNDGVISFYLPHLLGAAGARAYHSKLKADPHANTLKYLSYEVVSGNKGFFMGRSMIESYNRIKHHLKSLADKHGVSSDSIAELSTDLIGEDQGVAKVIKKTFSNAVSTEGDTTKTPAGVIALRRGPEGSRSSPSMPVSINETRTKHKRANTPVSSDDDFALSPSDTGLIKALKENTMALKSQSGDEKRSPLNITLNGLPDVKVDVSEKSKNARPMKINDTKIPSTSTGFDVRQKGV